MKLQSYTTPSGVELLYAGQPDFAKLDQLADGPGDLWHSGPDQGFRDAFPEIVYQTTVFIWYVHDFEGLDQVVSWRINPEHFAVRKSVWEHFGGFAPGFKSQDSAALHFGYNSLMAGAVLLYVKGLFPSGQRQPQIPTVDRYRFFRLSFDVPHTLFMLARRWWNPAEWIAFMRTRITTKKFPLLPPPVLNDKVDGNPTVTYLVPSMGRQEMVVQLLGDLAGQTWLPHQVIIVDATPEDERDETLYKPEQYPFKLEILWQTIKGSCRQRNIGIGHATGDYILFGDDDLRLPPEFIENHLKFVQTRNVSAATGLDIRAHNHLVGLDYLYEREKNYPRRWLAGVSQFMSSSNAIVTRDWVNRIGGNDLNYEGGYGEDNDFGLTLTKQGCLVLHNPYGLLLHLKPPTGGYRMWGQQAKIIGKQRKRQPWELDTPVGRIKPSPGPTLMYYYMKHFRADDIKEYRIKNTFNYLVSGGILQLPKRILKLPMRRVQFRKSVFYARKLMALGVRR